MRVCPRPSRGETSWSEAEPAAPPSAASSATGIVKVNRVPRPAPSLSARMRPPWASTDVHETVTTWSREMVYKVASRLWNTPYSWLSEKRGRLTLRSQRCPREKGPDDGDLRWHTRR